MRHIIAASRLAARWDTEQLARRTGHQFTIFSSKEDVTGERVAAIQPRYIFFPHWSYLIPPDVYQNFECVVFHMTNLPFGRGGSPLQNLIARGIYETKISALRCEKELDAGPIYMKRPLSLDGTAEEIYQRAAGVMEEMIVEMVEKEPKPVPQSGKPVKFRRRKPEESDLKAVSNLRQAFDHIRMLDADGYPRAFLETEHLRLEFSQAALKDDHVAADVKITYKRDHE